MIFSYVLSYLNAFHCILYSIFSPLYFVLISWGFALLIGFHVIKTPRPIYSNVPATYIPDFRCDDEESLLKLEDLKTRVRKSGLEQFT